MKHVAVRTIERADAALAARLGAAGTSTVHEAQGRTGLLDPALRPIYPCLLYTSPSPRDVEESRMPSSA